MTMPPSDKSTQLSRFFFGAGIGCLLFGLVLLSMNHHQFGDFENWSIDKATIVEGVLEIPRSTGQSTPIGIRMRDGQIISCYIGRCGYNGIRNDLGKNAKAWLLNGIFVQIEVDGVTKITLPDRVAALQSNIVPELAIIISPFFMIIGYYIRRKYVASAGQESSHRA